MSRPAPISAMVASLSASEKLQLLRDLVFDQMETANIGIPVLPPAIVVHDRIGPLFDALQLHCYLVKHAYSIVRFLAKSLAPDIKKAESSSKPTLEDGDFFDRAVAQVGCHVVNTYRGTTNAISLLVRPIDIRSDESGEHPGETFVMVSLTREELHEIVKLADDDWADLTTTMASGKGG